MTNTRQGRLDVGGETAGSESSLANGAIGIARAAVIRDPTNAGLNNESTLPEDYAPLESSDSPEEYPLETRWFTEGFRSRDANAKIEPHHLRWICGGDLTAYVERYSDRTFGVPSSYSSFNQEWETYVGKIDTYGEQYGWGITSNALERALRILSGGGRYQETRYQVIACGNHPWVLTGPSGTALCAPVAITTTVSSDRHGQVTVGGDEFAVTEENEAVLTGMEILFEISDNLHPVEYDGLKYSSRNQRSSYHRFELSDDSVPSIDEARTRLSPADLYDIGSCFPQPDAVRAAAAQTVGSKADEWLPPAKPGERTDLGIVAGYQPFTENCEESATVRSGIKTIYIKDSTKNLFKIGSILNIRADTLHVQRSQGNTEPLLLTPCSQRY